MLTLWRYLRNRILLTNLLVLLSSAGVILLLTRIVMMRLLDQTLRPSLITLSQSLGDPAIIYLVEQQTLAAFRNAVILSVLVSSLITVLVSVGVSLWLWRSIVRPLQQLETSTQRIAAGQYRERIPSPGSKELDTVVTAFNQMATSLDETEQRRISLINNVAHELRTPLTSLTGYLEALADGYFTLDAETIGEMQQEVGRLTRLVENVNTLSRIEDQQIDVKPTRLDLVPLVQRVTGQVRPNAQAKQIDLSVQLPATCFVSADDDATMQVLFNLLSNALRYTPENGEITVLLTTHEAVATVTVADNGIGIPAADLPHIFERFYRVDHARAHHADGTGVGLTIARHLAWSLDGDIVAESAGVGRGSRFHFSLPLAA